MNNDFINNPDPKILAFQKALAQKESGNVARPRESAITLGEGSIGRFQYLPATFNTQAIKFFGGKNPLTGKALDIRNDDDQKMVNYKYVEDKMNTKDANGNYLYSPQDVAASHNAGEGRIKSWQTHKGTNSFGNNYDVPAYVADVMGKYKTNLSDMKEAGLIEIPEQITPEDSKRLQEMTDEKAKYDRENEISNKSNMDNYGGVIGGTLNFGQDLGRGVVNSASRAVTDFGSMENAIYKKVTGNDLYESPRYHYDSKSNEYATGGFTDGANAGQKIGGFVGDIAQLYGGGGIVAKGVSKIPRAYSYFNKLKHGKYLLNFLTDATTGLGFEAMREGEITPTGAALNIGGAAVGGYLNRGRIDRAGQKGLEKAYKEALATGDETAIKTFMKDNPTFTFNRGGGTAEDIVKNTDKVATVLDDTFREAGSTLGNISKYENILSRDVDELGKSVILRDLSSNLVIGKDSIRKGTLDFTDTMRNIDSQFGAVSKDLENTTVALTKLKDVGTFSPEALVMRIKKLAHEDKYLGPEAKEYIDRKASEYVQKTVAGSKNKRPDFEALDYGKRTSNKVFGEDSNLSAMKQIQGKAIRDLLLHRVENKLGSQESLNLLGKYIEQNKLHSSLKSQQELIKLFGTKIKAGLPSGVLGYLGGIAASGGAFNPIAYVVGKMSAEFAAKQLAKTVLKNSLLNNARMMTLPKGVKLTIATEEAIDKAIVKASREEAVNTINKAIQMNDLNLTKEQAEKKIKDLANSLIKESKTEWGSLAKEEKKQVIEHLKKNSPDNMYKKDSELPTIDAGETPKSKYKKSDSSLPTVDTPPNVNSKDLPPVVEKPKVVEEGYIPDSELPTIQMGDKGKSKYKKFTDNLPSINSLAGLGLAGTGATALALGSTDSASAKEVKNKGNTTEEKIKAMNEGGTFQNNEGATFKVSTLNDAEKKVKSEYGNVIPNMAKLLILKESTGGNNITEVLYKTKKGGYFGMTEGTLKDIEEKRGIDLSENNMGDMAYAAAQHFQDLYEAMYRDEKPTGEKLWEVYKKKYWTNKGIEDSTNKIIEVLLENEKLTPKERQEIKGNKEKYRADLVRDAEDTFLSYYNKLNDTSREKGELSKSDTETSKDSLKVDSKWQEPSDRIQMTNNTTLKDILKLQTRKEFKRFPKNMEEILSKRKK